MMRREGRSQFHLRRLSMKTVTPAQAALSPTPRIRNAGHPFSMLPVRTLKFCPQNPARKAMGRKMVATAASRRLTIARCLVASEACPHNLAGVTGRNHRLYA